MAKAQTRAQIEAIIAPAVATLPGAETTFESYATSHGTAYRELLVLAILQERQRGLGRDMIARTEALLASPLFSADTMHQVASIIDRGLDGTRNLPAVQITADTGMQMVHGAATLTSIYIALRPSSDIDAMVDSEDMTATPRRILQVRGMIQALLDNPRGDALQGDGTVPRDVGEARIDGRNVVFDVPGCNEKYGDGTRILLHAASMAHRPLTEVARSIIPQTNRIAERNAQRNDALAQAKRIRETVETVLSGTRHRVLSVHPLDQNGIAFHHDVTISGIGDDLKPTEIVLQIWPTPSVKPEAETLDRFVTRDIARFLRSQDKLAARGTPADIGDYLIERPLARMLRDTFGTDTRGVLEEVVAQGIYEAGSHLPDRTGRRDVRLHVTIDRGVIRGRFDLAPGVRWHEGSFRMPQAMIPETVAQDMRGRPITDVVAHEWLDDAMAIETVTRGANKGLTLSAHGATCTVAEALERQ